MSAYIIEAKRTAIGRAHQDKGLYRDVRADELLAALIQGLLSGLQKDAGFANEIEDVFIGCVGQHLEQGKNIARLAALLAGLPDTVPGATINRLCASSLQAFQFCRFDDHFRACRPAVGWRRRTYGPRPDGRRSRLQQAFARSICIPFHEHGLDRREGGRGLRCKP